MHGKTKIQVLWRSLLNGCIPLKIQHFVCVDTLVTSRYKYIVSSCNDIFIWISPKAEKVWNVCKSNTRCSHILQHGWHSHLPFHAKLFMWRVLISGLPLGSTLKRQGLVSGTCFFCIVVCNCNSSTTIVHGSSSIN